MTDAVLLADDYWSYHRSTSQFWNIDRGDVDQIEHWEDLSVGALALRVEVLLDFERRAEGQRSATVDARELSLLGALSFSAGSLARTLPFARDLTLVGAPFSVATFLSVLVPQYALVTREHGEGYVSKLATLPAFIDGWIEGLRDGVACGRVATRRGILGAVAAFDRLLTCAAAEHPLARQEPPRELGGAATERWHSDVVDRIERVVQPALARLGAFLSGELMPLGRDDDRVGVCHIDGGDEGYSALLWAATSTRLRPAEVHQLGIAQLGELDNEYRALGSTVLGIADPVQLRRRLRDDPSLNYSTAEEIIRDAMATLDRAEAEASRWFSRLPVSRCTAVATDAGPMAYYTAPSPDGARSGTFYFTIGDPSAWKRYQLEVTTFHESVPGHHMQVALAGESNLHPILGELEVASYGEGWGLYAERLADEMGLYSSPLQRLGMLTLDSLRAARLVVDTGIHAFGWTRKRAIDFLVRHTTLDRSNASGEIDRYIADPGQATSYMIGRLELERIRRRTHQRLGPRFDLGQFHDAVLANGMTPLDELARSIDTLGT